MYFLSVCGQLDQKIDIVGIDLGGVSRAISYARATAFAFMRDDIAALGVGVAEKRAQGAAAGVGAIPGHNINVARIKTKGAMVSGSKSQGANGFAAMQTDKAVVIF